MRRLLSVAVDPEIISLAGGLPATDRLPADGFLDCLQAVLDREGSRALQYSPMYEPLRGALADFMDAKGVECQPEQILITSGSQQGLAILSRLFLDPGDPAVVEQVTFTGTQQITAGRGAEIRTVPTDWETGVELEALEQAFRLPERPRLAVLMPDFHNPLGVCISEEKRARIAQLAGQHGVPVIEDDPYSSLRFDGGPIPPLKAYDRADHIIYLGSFSKILAPAVRMGWMVAPLELMPQITVIRESLDLETSGLLQRAVAEFLMGAGFTDHLAKLTATYRQRCGALLAALEDHLAGIARWTRPQGGLFVWVELPEGIDTLELFDRALERKVAYVPGSAFAVEGGFQNTMRLSFSNLEPSQIRMGVERLADLIKASLG